MPVLSEIDLLPVFPVGPPGPMRERLVAAIVSGVQTTGTRLRSEYPDGSDPFAERGQRFSVSRSSGEHAAVVEVTEITVVPLAEVGLDHAVAEGLGHDDLARWRIDHEQYWRAAHPGVQLGDETEVVLIRFRVV